MPLVVSTLLLIVLSGGFVFRLPAAVDWLQLAVPKSWALDAMSSATDPAGLPDLPTEHPNGVNSDHNW